VSEAQPSALDPQLVAKLKEQHGPYLIAVHAKKHILVFRKPTRGEYDEWSDKTHSDKAQQSRHNRELAKRTVVHPSEDALQEVLDDQPALLGAEILSAVTQLAGLQDTVHIAKL
jgi:hypothetical protein